ncbi:GNAT family protein [Ornithinimicrobium cerasi]|uniref:Protein N-acetyltransferase, RimJ/RimL family n=1 Tax=Ornithinimicrobium cerasi TaxID=2248773 RepID=A0A285VP81_9MICO|nr:GNAT family protein [Ornithinimicrobium cerasi]SOC55763.1 Protein N-acetyltransferase, RimJ/RimL family [Ornithinimicrobium cerasi]
MTDDGIALVRLTEVPIEAVCELLNDGRSRRHLPLATGQFSLEQVADWVREKNAQWDDAGYGPWAITVGGRLVGWGGFQREESGADFALVLDHADWGLGRRLFPLMLERGFTEFGFDTVTIALPFTRDATRVVTRLGFEPDGEVTYGNTSFRQYRLSRADWQAEAEWPPS